MHELIIRDAAEVRGMESPDDPWRKALLVVRNVEKVGRGKSPTGDFGKVSAEAYAAEVNLRGWGEHVIARIIKAWDRAANAGLVPPAKDMVPGQELESPIRPWTDFYDGTEGDTRYPTGEQRDRLVAQAKRDEVGHTKVLDIAKNPRAMHSAIVADPQLALAARAALAEADENFKLSVIADGGRIPSLHEDDHHSGKIVDVIIGNAERFARLIKQLDKAIDAIVEAGPWGPDTEEAEELRARNLRLLDAIATGVRK